MNFGFGVLVAVVLLTVPGALFAAAGSAWMYAVADLHPLRTHHFSRVAAAVRALNIYYVLISSPVVRGFVVPDGLVSLDKSASWVKIYDNGGARVHQWRGTPDTPPAKVGEMETRKPHA